MIQIVYASLIVGAVLIGEFYLAAWVGSILRKKNKRRKKARIVYMNRFPGENDPPVESWEVAN